MATKKTGATKLTAKEFTVHPTTGKVLISQDKISKLVQTNLDKIKANTNTKAVSVGVVVDF